MIRPALQVAVVLTLTTTTLSWHVASKALVANGFGLIALVIILALLKPLSRYLD